MFIIHKFINMYLSSSFFLDGKKKKRGIHLSEGRRDSYDDSQSQTSHSSQGFKLQKSERITINHQRKHNIVNFKINVNSELSDLRLEIDIGPT